jgi:hypothetical protein
MGRITEAIESEDGKVRKAEVMVYQVYRHGEKKTYTRPIGELKAAFQLRVFHTCVHARKS